jgi:hypothetical protein
MNKSVGKVSTMAEIVLGFNYKGGFGDGQSHSLMGLAGSLNNCQGHFREKVLGKFQQWLISLST